jgi:hypothetical protein
LDHLNEYDIGKPNAKDAILKICNFPNESELAVLFKVVADMCECIIKIFNPTDLSIKNTYGPKFHNSEICLLELLDNKNYTLLLKTEKKVVRIDSLSTNINQDTMSSELRSLIVQQIEIPRTRSTKALEQMVACGPGSLEDGICPEEMDNLTESSHNTNDYSPLIAKIRNRDHSPLPKKRIQLDASSERTGSSEEFSKQLQEAIRNSLMENAKLQDETDSGELREMQGDARERSQCTISVGRNSNS